MNRGNTKHGQHGSLTYARWKSMMQRCSPSSARRHVRYAVNAITVCERWKDFSNFMMDMGECPNKTMTLDRIDNARGYEPGNCRWATKVEQSLNRSMTVLLNYNGVTQSVTEWASAIGMSANTLHHRIALGWTVERALTQPLKKRGARAT